MIDFLVDNPRLSWRAALAFGFFIIIAAAILLWHTWWGDPVIYLPYARNAAAGIPFHYNPGTFSSGSTSPLWGLILSLAYVFGAGALGAKVIALLATLGAFAALAWMAARIAGRSIGSGIALLFAVEMLTLYGLMMYESALVVAAVAASIVAGERARRLWQDRGRLVFGDIVPLIGIWSVLPLSRPDATVLVPLQIAALWLPGPRRTVGALLLLISGALIAAVPSALYFGYSFITLGAVSVSSKARAFALQEAADRIGPILLSRSALAYLGSSVYAIGLAAIGIDRLARGTESRWIAAYAATAIVMYPLLLVFVSPVTNDLPRYFLPIAPFIVLGAAIALRRAEGALHGGWVLAPALVLLLFVVKPPVSVLSESYVQSKRGYTFNEIVERDVIGLVNRIAKPGDTLLAYEVQDRYLLRPDMSILSLDGITDGLVVPYLSSGDMLSFLLRYRPDYWLANDAVRYRPYLRRSILSRVVSAFEADSTLRSFDIEGIRFQLLARRTRPMPKGFAGWRALFRMEYGRYRNDG